jgi:hypothetical protein
MSRAFLAAILSGVVTLSGAWPGHAADRALTPRRSASAQAPVFPRSERAQAVWAGDRCWKECGAYTAWDLAACLKQDTQGHCLKATDAADRACQRDCRRWGGPLLPLDF